MAEKKKQALFQAALDLLPSVRDVIEWTLVHAGIFTFAFAFATAYFMLITSHPLLAALARSWLLPRAVETTDAEEAEAVALMAGMRWCTAAQAAAGVLALMLPSHRRRLRLLLAYAALVATAAGDCMFAVGHRMLVDAADPGGLSFRSSLITATIFIFVVGDVRCFLGLVLRGGEE